MTEKGPETGIASVGLLLHVVEFTLTQPARL